MTEWTQYDPATGRPLLHIRGTAATVEGLTNIKAGHEPGRWIDVDDPDLGWIDAPPEPATALVLPSSLLRSQVIRALARYPEAGGDPWITQAEALAWSADAAALPPPIADAIAALTDEADRIDKLLLAHTFQTVDRIGPMSALITAAFGASPAQRDALFVLGAGL